MLQKRNMKNLYLSIAQLKALRFPSNKDSYQQTPTQVKHLPPRALLWLLIKPFTALPEPNIKLRHLQGNKRQTDPIFIF